MDHDCTFGFALGLLAFDHGERRVDGDLGHAAAGQAGGGLELIQRGFDELD